MENENAMAEKKLMAIQETINEYCGGHVLSDFLGFKDHIHPGVFRSLLNLAESVEIHIAEIDIHLVILRLIEANHRMIEFINNTNNELRKLQKELEE